MISVKNAIIMAAGTSSRFAPLSFEKPKALIEVKGEILIERQIRQLLDVGISNIYIVVGYKKEEFIYLVEKYNVKLIENDSYLTRNNNASIKAVENILGDSYVCSADNYFLENPFTSQVEDSYYAAQYSEEYTQEWCMKEDKKGFIEKVVVGGNKSWYMIGHTFWSEDFTKKMLTILNSIYDDELTKDLLWESIFIKNLNVLKMKIKKYNNVIFEFDTLDELRLFDLSYIDNTRSSIIKSICVQLKCEEKDVKKIIAFKNLNNSASGFEFEVFNLKYKYFYDNQKLEAM